MHADSMYGARTLHAFDEKLCLVTLAASVSEAAAGKPLDLAHSHAPCPTRNLHHC